VQKAITKGFWAKTIKLTFAKQKQKIEPTAIPEKNF